MRQLLALLILLAPVAVWAGGAEVAAALKDEASECRYLLAQCRLARDLDASGNSGGSRQAWVNARETAVVIRAKHETRPACFTECVDILKGFVIDLDAFK